MKIYRLTAAFLLAALFFSGCSKNPKTPEDELTAVLDPIEAEIPDGGTEEISPSVFPEQEFVTLPSEVPYPEDFSGTSTKVGAINYFNYRNQLPVITTESGVLVFNYDGSYSFTDRETSSGTDYHIGDFISVSIYSQGNADYNNWYFMGAIKTSNGIYAHYDYLGSIKLSFFITMGDDGSDPAVCVSTPYLLQESLNVFTATENGIYFTYVIWKDGLVETSLLFAEANGDNPRVINTFEPGHFLSYLFPAEDKLYFLLSSDSSTDLMKFETETRQLTTLLPDSRAAFLYISGDYAILSHTEKSLTFYNMETKHTGTITVTSGEQYAFSAPFYDHGSIYAAVYSLDHSSPTELIPILLEEQSTGKKIRLSDTFYYCLGISNGIVYTENGSTYRYFDLTTGRELEFPDITE